MSTRILLATVFVLAALSLTGCQPVQTAFTPKQKVITKEATIAVAAAPVVGDLPEGLPEDLPLWPGATVADPEVSEDGAITFVLETSEDFDTVLPGITVGLERAGWEAVQSLEEESATALDISNGSYQGILTLTRSESGTSLEYFLMKESS